MTREEYAAAVALASAQVVAAVYRGEDTTSYVTAALSLEAPPDTDPVVALATVLAAQVDPDTTLAERLAWCHPDVRAACEVAS